MKKVLFMIIVIFFPFVINAECDYKEEKNVTSLSVYINQGYVYNEDTKSFDVYFYNLQNMFAIKYDSKSYVQDKDNRAVIRNVPIGTSMEIEIFTSGDTDCRGKTVRNITINLPYLNPYYGSNECIKYPTLTVCYSRFLSFDISYTTFKNALKREDEKQVVEIKEPGFFEIAIKFITNNYIKILLISGTTVISLLFYKRKYRKSKHGF